jgi:hypothetical protein
MGGSLGRGQVSPEVEAVLNRNPKTYEALLIKDDLAKWLAKFSEMDSSASLPSLCSVDFAGCAVPRGANLTIALSLCRWNGESPGQRAACPLWCVLLPHGVHRRRPACRCRGDPDVCGGVRRL